MPNGRTQTQGFVKAQAVNVVIDTVIGAYPSQVNLKDGSVRVVYYEEGGGSNIRSRRFKATREGD